MPENNFQVEWGGEICCVDGEKGEDKMADADQKLNKNSVSGKTNKGKKRLVIALIFICVIVNFCLGLHFIITTYRENLAVKEPLCFAVINDNLEEVERLIREGADVNAKILGGHTPLIIAIRNHNSLIAEKLLQAGANPNQRDNLWLAPLHHAVSPGDGTADLDIIRVLVVKHGAKVDIKDFFGNTPLHEAAESGELEAVQLLLEYGADPHMEDYHRRTAADRAVLYPKIRSILKQAGEQ